MLPATSHIYGQMRVANNRRRPHSRCSVCALDLVYFITVLEELESWHGANALLLGDV